MGRALLIAAAAFAAAMSAAAGSAQDSAGARKPERIRPLPAVVSPDENLLTEAKAELGKRLFFDPRLSGDNTMSCATCHVPEKAFADGLALGKGHGGRDLARNTPTVLNVAHYPRLMWDGRTETLEEQALLPIQAAEEMNQDLDELVNELQAVPGYVEQFEKVFGGEVTKERIGQALAAFQRTLVTGPSPFDRYLQGDKTALSAAAIRGWELFQNDAGCIRCHNGPLLSDGGFYRLGIGRGDDGRSAISKKPDDRGKYRTPSLRNIALTAPYMHDGSHQTLTDVVTFYYRGVSTDSQDGLPMDVEPLLGQSFSEIPDLVAFLESLTGEPPKITPPKLP
jgi:cytochrome c peroxidase